MSNLVLKAREVYTEAGIVENAYLTIVNGRIASIGEEVDHHENFIDLGDCKLVPGFIDLHIHGSGGADVMDATYDAVNTISKAIAANGVTGFLATTVTSTWDATLAALRNIDASYQKGVEGAELLGGYSEGLFFSERFKGAHAAEYFLTPTIKRIDAMLDAAGGHLRSLAIAPEIDGAVDAVRYLSEKGVNVMLGHTGASYAQCQQAFEAGAVGGVHIFNQMAGLHHRQPGTVGAVLHNQEAIAEMIADGVHVDPVVMSLVYRLKGAEKIALITDCMCAGGLNDGEYQLGQLMVTVKDGIARTHTGALAGSTLTLNKGVANMISKVDVSPLDAVHMASLTPATLLGIQENVGSIKKGKRGNIAVLDSHNDIVMTLIDGCIIYQR